MVFFMESLKNKRLNNEDSYCHMEIRLNHEAKVNAFCVSDGMGGLDAGKEYSEKAVSLWFKKLVGVLMGYGFANCSLETQIETLKEFSEEVIHEINKELYELGMDAGRIGGTTLSTVIHFWDTWIIANLGDSPVYMMKNGTLELVSEIQNVAWQMVKEQKTQVGSTLFYQNKNRLLEYLGRRDEIHPYVNCVEDQEIQALILGSDGAFGDLSMTKIESILQQFAGQEQALSYIMEFAREHGENDNQTAILIYPTEKAQKHNHQEKAAPKDTFDEVFLGREGKDYMPLLEKEVYRELDEPSIRKRFRSYFSKRDKGGSDL